MALEDLAMMRAIAGGVVLYPADAVAAEKLAEEAARLKGICFLRTSARRTPVIYENQETFPVGGAKVLRQAAGDKVTVVGAGVTLFEALKAADLLAAEKITITVIDAYSIKPLARDVIRAAARKTNLQVITVEDHYPEGGLGDAVAGDCPLMAFAFINSRSWNVPVLENPKSCCTLQDRCGHDREW